MKKLLQVNSTANSGSTGRIAEQIGQLAINAGWDSYIAYGRSSNVSKSNLVRVGGNTNGFIHFLSNIMLDNHGLTSVKATKAFIERIKAISPDIIHLHNIHGYYINYELLFDYFSAADIPVVWTLHDCWAYTGHCSYYSDIDCQKWQTNCKDCPKKHNYPKSLLLDRSLRNFRKKKACFNTVNNLTLVPVSHWLEEEVKKSFLKENHIRCILNGVDVNRFKPSGCDPSARDQYGLKDKKVLLGVATAWGPRKGWRDYIRLSQELPNDYKIVMVGVTEKQAKELPENILAIRRTESVEQLADLYSMADVVLNLSDEESFGLTSAEGFACGTPSIVYNCTASPELITPNTGIVIEKGDRKALVEAIITITSKGKEYYSYNCRNRAIECYDKNKNYQQYIELYNELLYL